MVQTQLPVLQIVDKFNQAFNRHDIDEVMAMMTDDCVFENTFPAPDGKRIEGQKAVREVFTDFFNSSPQAIFEFEDIFGCDERAAVRWLYRWGGVSGRGHVRGVDIFRVRDGKISEKFSYVKG